MSFGRCYETATHQTEFCADMRQDPDQIEHRIVHLFSKLVAPTTALLLRARKQDVTPFAFWMTHSPSTGPDLVGNSEIRLVLELSLALACELELDTFSLLIVVWAKD